MNLEDLAREQDVYNIFLQLAKIPSPSLKEDKVSDKIIELLKEEISEERIVNQLVTKYENDRDTLTTFVHQVVNTLRNAGLLME